MAKFRLSHTSLFCLICMTRDAWTILSREDSGGNVAVGVGLENYMPIVQIAISVSYDEDVLMNIRCSSQNDSITLYNTQAIGVVPEQPPFWFEPQPPPLLPAPQFVNDTTNGASEIQVLAPTPILSAMLEKWAFRTFEPGRHWVTVSLYYTTPAGATEQEALTITLVAKPTLSASAPRVGFLTADEAVAYETPSFSWAGSFSHLIQGKEQPLPPEWIVPACFATQTAAAWTPCPRFFAPGSPAVYAEVYPQDPAVAAVSRTLAAAATPSECNDSGLLEVIVVVQNANSSRRNFPGAPWAAIPADADDTFPQTFFECRAGPAQCEGSSPTLRLGSVAGLTFWPDPQYALPAGNGAGYRMRFTGRVGDVRAALANITVTARATHLGSNVVRVEVRDVPAEYNYTAATGLEWDLRGVDGWGRMAPAAARAECSARPDCYGFQAWADGDVPEDALRAALPAVARAYPAAARWSPRKPRRAS